MSWASLLATGTTDLAGLRDRALFLIDFGGAFRRAEIVEIEWMLLKVSVGAMGWIPPTTHTTNLPV